MTVLKYMLFEMNYIHLSCKTFVSYLSHWFGHIPSSVLRLYFFHFYIHSMARSWIIDLWISFWWNSCQFNRDRGLKYRLNIKTNHKHIVANLMFRCKILERGYIFSLSTLELNCNLLVYIGSFSPKCLVPPLPIPQETSPPSTV